LVDLFLVTTQNKAQKIYFWGLASFCHGTEPLRLALAVLRAYDSGIELQQILAIWNKINNDGTNFKTTAHPIAILFSWTSLEIIKDQVYGSYRLFFNISQEHCC